MKSLNKVMLIGNVGSVVEVQKLQSGTTIAHVSLATNRKWKDKAGSDQTDTAWHRLTFFGKLAEIAEKYVTKGMSLYVEGELRYSVKGEGADKKFFTEIVVGDMNMLSSGKGGEASAPRAKVQGNSAPAAEPEYAAALVDDGFPF